MNRIKRSIWFNLRVDPMEMLQFREAVYRETGRQDAVSAVLRDFMRRYVAQSYANLGLEEGVK